MTGIIITGHGYFAQGIMSAARLIAGDAEMISEVNFPEGMDINELRENMETAIRDMSTSQILILTDIMGGSPFNTASQLLTGFLKKNLISSPELILPQFFRLFFQGSPSLMNNLLLKLSRQEKKD